MFGNRGGHIAGRRQQSSNKIRSYVCVPVHVCLIMLQGGHRTEIICYDIKFLERHSETVAMLLPEKLDYEHC